MTTKVSDKLSIGELTNVAEFQVDHGLNIPDFKYKNIALGYSSISNSQQASLQFFGIFSPAVYDKADDTKRIKYSFGRVLFESSKSGADGLLIERFVQDTSRKFKSKLELLMNQFNSKIVCVADEWVHFIDDSKGLGNNIDLHSLNPFDGSYLVTQSDQLTYPYLANMFCLGEYIVLRVLK
jgi:hypothetical protein